MDTLSFDQLPATIAKIHSDVEFIKKFLTQIKVNQGEIATKWFSLPELCEYLPGKPSRPTIYGYVAANTIPFHKTPGSRRLRFKKSEIDAWLEQGSKKTISQIEDETDQYLQRKKLA